MNKRVSRFLTFLLIITFFTSSFVLADDLDIKDRTNAYLIGDYETGLILEEYNIDEPIEIASITKVMSYLVVADELKLGNISLDDSIYIDRETARVGGSSLKLKMGETLKVGDLLAGLMVVSGNDATYALAKHTFNTEEEFVEEMYRKAEELGLESAEFYNSTGLPEPSPTGNLEDRKQNKMSPRDIFTLTRYIIKEHPEVLEFTSMVKLSLPTRDYEKNNTNDLLITLPGVDGFKTGFTDKAGYCLVSTIPNALASEDSRLISVVMGAKTVQERSSVSRKLINYTSSNYANKNLLNTKKPIQAIPMKNIDGGYLKIYPKEDYREIINASDNLDMDIELKRFLSPSFKKGEVVGTATIYRNSEEIKKVDLIVKENIIKNTLLGKILGKIRFMFSKSS